MLVIDKLSNNEGYSSTDTFSTVLVIAIVFSMLNIIYGLVSSTLIFLSRNQDYTQFKVRVKIIDIALYNKDNPTGLSFSKFHVSKLKSSLRKQLSNSWLEVTYIFPDDEYYENLYTWFVKVDN
eukprot:UN03488